VKIIPHGAAREVTGTCHELQIETPSGLKRILLDCGLFQGSRQASAVKNAEFPFDPAKDIDAVILTHAHMDHAGRIPLLYTKGYRNKVNCTYATKDLSEVMLMDSGYIHEKDEEYFQKHLKDSMIKFDGPLYTQQDAIDCMEIFKGHNYNDWFEVCEGVKVQFIDAGHIVGAAMLVLEIIEQPSPRLRPSGNGKLTRLGFTGDLGRNMLPIIRDPADMPPVDVLICESTYGNREHEDIKTAKGHLKEVVIQTAKRGGKVMIPAFSLERTQEIVYDLHVLWDAKEIPAVPIFIDSPLATRVTEVFQSHPECYDKEMYEQFLARAHNPFQFSLVKYTESVEESKKLNNMPGPMVIMAGAGMCEAGRIRHHLKNEIEDPKNTVLAVGYMAENTLGRRIIDPEIHEVKIFDEILKKKAEIVAVNAYSGHADMADLDNMVMGVKEVKKIILVHGELDQMQPFADRIKHVRPEVEVVIPEVGEEIVI